MPATRFRYDAVGVGHACVDTLCLVPSYPPEEGKARIERIARAVGGQTLTAICALARLGRRVALAAGVGDDPDGALVEQALAEDGVDAGALVRLAGAATAWTMIAVSRDRGERTVFWHRGPDLVLRPEHLPPGFGGLGRVLLIDGHEGAAALAAARQARRAGARVVLDGELLPELAEEILAEVDVAIVSSAFGPAVLGIEEPGRVAAALAERGADTAIVTLGPDGARGRHAGRSFAVPGHRLPVTDTTGAGDIFHAGYVHGMLAGWPPERAAVFANALAALSVRHLGGRPGIATEAEALALAGLA